MNGVIRVPRRHPELRSNEVLIGNIPSKRRGDIFGLEDHLSDWDSIGWKTKRLGQVAYDIYGEPVRELQPVFAQKEELEGAGFVFPPFATDVADALGGE